MVGHIHSWWMCHLVGITWTGVYLSLHILVCSFFIFFEKQTHIRERENWVLITKFGFKLIWGLRLQDPIGRWQVSHMYCTWQGHVIFLLEVEVQLFPFRVEDEFHSFPPEVIRLSTNSTWTNPWTPIRRRERCGVNLCCGY